MAGRARIDVRIADGLVEEMSTRLRPTPGDEVVEARGGALIPGLHDHHIHLRAWAAALNSVDAGPPAVTDPASFSNQIRGAAGRLPPGAWLRAIGYHHSVAGDLDRWALDRVVADRPIRIQHRSGAMWTLNSRAVEAARLDRCQDDGVERDDGGRPTGRIWRLDGWLRTVLPSGETDLATVSQMAATAGVTGFTDATPDRTPEDLDGLVTASEQRVISQRLHLMCPPELDPIHAQRVTIGPVKVLLDDDRLPALSDLTAVIEQAHGRGRPVAIHCVTLLQLVLANTALGDAGPIAGDRIEHASVVPLDLMPALVKLGVTVVSQPSFVAERGDEYLDEVDASDQPSLYRCASYLEAGVPLAFGSDAPFGRYDPWAIIRAAVQRRTRSGRVLNAGERIDPAVALRLLLGHPAMPGQTRHIQTGGPADLCLLHVPLAEALGALDASVVAMTVVAGSVLASAPTL